MHFTTKAALLLISSCIYSISAFAQAKKYTVSEGISAQISHMQGNSTIDVVIPGVDKMSLDLQQPGTGIFQIKTTDYNFDGYKDFAFVGANAEGSIQVYDIFLYNPTEGGFEALEVPDGACEFFGNVRLSPAEKTLRSSCRNGNKSSQDVFKWTTPFGLELVKSEDNSTDAAGEIAEEKADQKAEKAAQRKEKREEISEQRKDRKAQKEDKQQEKEED